MYFGYILFLSPTPPRSCLPLYPLSFTFCLSKPKQNTMKKKIKTNQSTNKIKNYPNKAPPTPSKNMHAF